MTILAPLIIPDRLKTNLNFSRIITCYLIISVMDIILPFVLIISEISMISLIYWATPLSNGPIYICLIRGFFGMAIAIYQLINKYYGVSFSSPKWLSSHLEVTFLPTNFSKKIPSWDIFFQILYYSKAYLPICIKYYFKKIPTHMTKASFCAYCVCTFFLCKMKLHRIHRILNMH